MDYTLKRSHRKTIAILISRDGSVVVRAPLSTPVKVINEFVRSKESWIHSKQDLARRLPGIPLKSFQDGELFMYLGQNYSLVLKESAKDQLVLTKSFELSHTFQHKAQIIFTNWYRLQARRILTERVVFFASATRREFKNIRISSARTRWGSCSSRGTLSFTWRLVMAPLEVIDYVVVHELVHTKIRNHSPDFWEQVKGILPHYKDQIDWLKKNGSSLTLETNR